MDIRNHVGLTVLGVLFVVPSLTSCGWFSGNGNGDDQDSLLVSQLTIGELSAETNAFMNQTSETRKTIFGILKELEAISDETIELERKREKEGEVEDNLVDQIKDKLSAIESEILAAQQKAEGNELLSQRLDELKRVALEREGQLAALRKTYARKKSQLEKEYEELQRKTQELETQRDIRRQEESRLHAEIQRLEATRKNIWTRVADRMVESVDLIEVTTNRKGEPKNKVAREVVESKKKILRRAIDCYRKSLAEGDEAANFGISKAQRKLQDLENGDAV